MPENEARFVADRTALLVRIVDALQADERFLAAWLEGSFGRGEQDAWSDLDLHVVVSDTASPQLCASSWQSSPRVPDEHLALFKQFGEPAAVYEAHGNAPQRGTTTFVLYKTIAQIVDWTLIPRSEARCPQPSLLLFDKVGIPLDPPAQPESLAQRVEQASVQVAFFWTMVPILVKYSIRYDVVFFDLHLPVRETERLVEGRLPTYRPGWGIDLYETREARLAYLRSLCEHMDRLTAQVAQMGGTVPHPPWSVLDTWFAMARDPQRRTQYARDREQLLAQLKEKLEADKRCLAAWLDGSYARGEQDELSDLDLRVTIADEYSAALCSVPWQAPSSQTTPARLALFRQFGMPYVAWDTTTFASLAEEGSFTLTYYEGTGVHVDWVLIPHSAAQRFPASVLLFDKVGIPLKPIPPPEPLEQRIEKAADSIASFWMIAPMSVRYLLRRDLAYCHLLLEQLMNTCERVRGLLNGSSPEYVHVPLYRTSQEQLAALRQLCQQMVELMQEVANRGGFVPPPPLSTLEILFSRYLEEN